MPLLAEQLRCMPLFGGIPEDQLRQLAAIFTPAAFPEGATLFEAGDPASVFYLLVSGEVTISEEDQVRYQLYPPASIGELSALASQTRNTTATVGPTTELWQVSREGFHQFLAAQRDVALPFYQNLVQLLADKVQRDQLRLEDMRKNIIRTQKAMKQMRDVLLESEETPISESMHNTLEELIRSNRRANYRVKPPESLTAGLTIGARGPFSVVQISRTHISFTMPEGELPATNTCLSGVLTLGDLEIPISGQVLRTIQRRVDLALDLLIEEYSSTLDGFLTRVQMLDFMV